MYRRKFSETTSGVNSACGEQQYVLSNICINDKGKINKKPQITYGYAPTIVAEFHGNLPKIVVENTK